MQLANKNAVIYGGAGALGSAIARAFAREGARIFLAGRRRAPLESVADIIVSEGGEAHAATVDALDRHSVNEHMDALVKKFETIDISINAIGLFHIQGIPLVDLTQEEFAYPIQVYTTSNFLTASAAARYMIRQRSGVILTLSTPGSLLADGVAGGFGVTCAAVEGLTRQLAGELGPYGIRAICLRPDAVPEASFNGSHSREVFAHRAQLMDMTLEEMMAGMKDGALLQRSPTLEDVANAAVFMASDKARAITATVANISCGSVVG